jgi:hypothetical protein|tara:strand:+ start:741 stop:923 length:183 start_codon:yes stop_codon:yes gene_type:complete
MPMWLRNFTYKKLNEFYDEQNKLNNPKSNNDIDLANPNKSKIPSKRTVSPPSYVAKASKK